VLLHLELRHVLKCTWEPASFITELFLLGLFAVDCLLPGAPFTINWTKAHHTFVFILNRELGGRKLGEFKWMMIRVRVLLPHCAIANLLQHVDWGAAGLVDALDTGVPLTRASMLGRGKFKPDTCSSWLRPVFVGELDVHVLQVLFAQFLLVAILSHVPEFGWSTFETS